MPYYPLYQLLVISFKMSNENKQSMKFSCFNRKEYYMKYFSIRYE